MKIQFSEVEIEQMAGTAYEAYRGYGMAQGESALTLPGWQILDRDRRRAVVRSVRSILERPEESVAELHDAWVAERTAEGWRPGSEFNASARTHTWLVPFAHLDQAKRMQYHLMRGVVQAFVEGRK